MEKKHNGFTLVEIIVSIAIGAVVMLIAGAMILSSSNFMMTTTEMDLDKRATDSIIDFIRDEIEYSTDVRFVTQDSKLVPNYTEDSDWHYIYIDNAELYRDAVRMFDKGFTNNKSLSISVKGNGTSNANHRLDIKYSLLNNKGESSYSSRDTVMFLNLSVSDEILKNGLYSDDYKELSKDGYWLFYTKKAKDLSSKPDDNTNAGTGTVADQLKFLNIYNNRNSLEDSNMDANGKYINQYEFVFFDGYWWQLIDQSTYYGYDSEKPDFAYKFKRISMEFCYASAYEAGDIVMYNGDYYYCTQRMVNNGFTKDYTTYFPLDGTWRGNAFWRKANESDLKNPDGTYKDGSIFIDQNRANQSTNKYDTTILSKIKDLNCDKAIEFNAANNANIPVVDRKKGVQQSDLYKITEKDIITHTEKIRYFIKLFETTQLPGQGSSGNIGWQEITMDYVPNSAYVEGDIVNQPYTLAKANGVSMRAGILLCVNDVKYMSDLYKDINYTANDKTFRWSFID